MRMSLHGGEEGQCGWLEDRFDVSRQIAPDALPTLMASDDRAAAQRVHKAMKKIDIAKKEKRR